MENFNITEYTSKRWYVHQQAVTQYSPIEQNFCTYAEYTIKPQATFWGYTVGVNNYAQDQAGNKAGGPLCAFQDKDVASKLNVAPCFLPKEFAGPYWVVAYDETEGYALISGGQPQTVSESGGCRTGDGINNSGLWIFSRSSVRNETLIIQVRALAENKGFDLTVLNDVNQEGCFGDGTTELATPTRSPVETPICADREGSFPVFFGSDRDCDWVDRTSIVWCLFYSDRCPDTCGKC